MKVPLSIKQSGGETYRDWLTRQLDEQAGAERRGVRRSKMAMADAYAHELDYEELTRIVSERIDREPSGPGTSHAQVTLRDGTKARCHNCGSLECVGVSGCVEVGKTCKEQGCTCVYLDWCMIRIAPNRFVPKREKIPSASDPDVPMRLQTYNENVAKRNK